MTVPTIPGGPLLLDQRVCSSAKFNTIEMITPAWFLDVAPLLDSPAPRGGDQVLPGVAGEVPFPRRGTGTTHSLQLVVTGFVHANGTVFSDPFVGILTNWKYLRANVLDPIPTGDGTEACDLTLPTGHALGDITPLGAKVSRRLGPVWVATFNVKVPNAALPLP